MSLFAKLGKRQRRKITRQAEFAGFVPGDIVLGADAPADFFYVVLGGEAEVRDSATIHRIGRGDYFGETALFNSANRSATVVATNELYVIRLPAQVFLRLVQRNPSVSVAILKDLGDRMRRNDRQPLPEAA
jgi:CRP-like cAMP-binding protein